MAVCFILGWLAAVHSKRRRRLKLPLGTGSEDSEPFMPVWHMSASSMHEQLLNFHRAHVAALNAISQERTNQLTASHCLHLARGRMSGALFRCEASKPFPRLVLFHRRSTEIWLSCRLPLEVLSDNQPFFITLSQLGSLSGTS